MSVMIYTFTETNVKEAINDRYNKLKDLDYRDLLKLSVDPKFLNFTMRPSSFEKLFSSSIYLDFVYYLISYCKTLLDIEKRQSILEKEAKERGLPKPSPLRRDTEEIIKIGEKLSECYSAILIHWVKVKAKKTHIDFGTLKRENEFWEILILLTSKVCECFFSPDEFKYVEQELQRLVRTDVFNQSKRKHFEIEKLNKFPELGNGHAKENIDVTIGRIMKRSQMPSINWKLHYDKLRSDVKPLTTKMDPSDANTTRSTLFAFIAPAGKYKIKTLDEQRKINIQNPTRRASGIPSTRIPTLIEKEIKKKLTKDDSYRMDIPISTVSRSIQHVDFVNSSNNEYSVYFKDFKKKEG